jgi:hypothetical protein
MARAPRGAEPGSSLYVILVRSFSDESKEFACG